MLRCYMLHFKWLQNAKVIPLLSQHPQCLTKFKFSCGHFTHLMACSATERFQCAGIPVTAISPLLSWTSLWPPGAHFRHHAVTSAYVTLYNFMICSFAEGFGLWIRRIWQEFEAFKCWTSLKLHVVVLILALAVNCVFLFWIMMFSIILKQSMLCERLR